MDLSAPRIERARRSAEAAGLHNVTFEQADAEFHHFPVEQFQVAISRFGVMWAFPSITGNGTRVNHADQSIRDQRKRRHGGALRV